MEPRTITVGNQSDADAPTLAAALACAAPGDTLAIAAGVYEETLHLDFDITVTSAPPLEGEGNSSEFTRAVLRGPVVTSANVRLENVEVQGMVSVRKGRATVAQCDIHHGSDGVRVYTGAAAEIRSCRVHHCSDGGDGVYFMRGSAGAVVDTDVFDCRVHGVHVQGSVVLVHENRVRDCTFGLFYEQAAAGRCEGNTVEHVRKFGIFISDDSIPAVSRNTVRECGVLCLYVARGGGGRCSQNVFDGSVHVLANCPIQLSANQVSGMSDIDAVGAAGVAVK